MTNETPEELMINYDLSTIDGALEFIKMAHADQQYGGLPYWNHPVDVMNRLSDLGLEPSTDENIAALLHDVVEDTIFSASDLRMKRASADVVKTVSWLTRPNDLTYMDWITRLAQKGPLSAVKVKYADNIANSSSDLSNLDAEHREKVISGDHTLSQSDTCLM